MTVARSVPGPARSACRLRFLVRHARQNALFRKMRFSLPGQTWRRLTEKCILQPAPHGKAQSGAGVSRKSAFWPDRLTEKRTLRLSVTSRRPGGVGQPPARLRGTMENVSTGQMRSSNHPPACGAACARVRRSRFGAWPHGKAHSAQPVGFRMRFSVMTRPQNAPFREGAGAECAFS